MKTHRSIIGLLAIPSGLAALFLITVVSGTSTYVITASHADGYYSNRGDGGRYSNDNRDREHRDRRDREDETQRQPYYQSPYVPYTPYVPYAQPYSPYQNQ
jgi:uncharacterized membrane protein